MYTIVKNLGRKILIIIAVVLLLMVGCKTGQKVQRDTEGFVQIFNGKTLYGWLGDTTYWSVENGNLVGIVTPATLLKRNTFIIWQGKMPQDFELKVEYKVSRQGNSGINYRSELIDSLPYALRGYQSDIAGSANITGSNYEERRRTTLASVGQKTLLSPTDGKSDSLKSYIKNNRWTPSVVTTSLGDPKELVQNVRSEDWNECHLIVKGNRMQHFVNGVLMSEVVDEDTVNRRFNGYLGVQVHVGPPMKIEYKNFRLKPIR